MSKQIKLSFLALASLILGLYLYYFERNGFLVFNNIVSAKVLNIFGNIGYNLPSLLHAFSFSLLSIIILGAKRKHILFSTALWFLIELLFELGQLPFFSQQLTPLGISQNSFIGNYFYNGTFDILDVLASLVGVMLAILLFHRELRAT